MNRKEIKAEIVRNLENSGMQVDKVSVQADPYGGWNIAVISHAFEGISETDRRSMSLAGLDDLTTEWVELLTPEEAEWAGPLPGDIEHEDLPLWPESLARSGISETPGLRVLSDMDEDIERPIIVTFYSLRGGVGRSTALAYTARILASHRQKVVCVDMDLEAPALPELLGCESDVRDDQGVVELLMALDQGETPDFARHLLPVTDSDNLFVIPAGRLSADYARKLRFIDPTAWYREERNPLRRFSEGLKNGLPFLPDIILLDARTGITDLSGPLLFDINDIAVVVFFPHPQARHGTELLTRSLIGTVTGRQIPEQTAVAPEFRFLISPIPASRSKEVIQRYRRRPLDWIDQWLEALNIRRQNNDLPPVPAEEITHFVPYQESVATSDRVGTDRDMWHAFEPVAEWIRRFLPSRTETLIEESAKELKPLVLRELRISVGTAEQQEEFIQNFVQTENVRDALSPDIPLVLGRMGTGKTAIFRYLTERTESSDTQPVIVHAPAGLGNGKTWLLSADGFKEIDRIISETGLEWRHFWMLYICVALEQHGISGVPRPDHIVAGDISSQGGIIDAFEVSASFSRAALSLGEWIQSMDRAVNHKTVLLLDGLDTGFGSTEEERGRRKGSIEGLFSAWTDLGQGLENLCFKILLREDIWRQLRFENKSHLYGRSVRLRWSDQTEFLKVPLKQAMRSPAFREHDVLQGVEGTDVDTWSEESVHTAWNVLVGERMRGSGTTYTRKWVWNRLTDANGNHSPGHLLQLFHEAIRWERDEEKRNSYQKTFIRPRALIRCLPKVSEEAIGALREEFSELNPLLEKLKTLGRTPILADELQKHDKLVSLAREVGLFAVYEESGDEIVRYTVPDLYRDGLKMTRKVSKLLLWSLLQGQKPLSRLPRS